MTDLGAPDFEGVVIGLLGGVEGLALASELLERNLEMRERARQQCELARRMREDARRMRERCSASLGVFSLGFGVGEAVGVGAGLDDGAVEEGGRRWPRRAGDR